jgi:hypothetical protein
MSPCGVGFKPIVNQAKVIFPAVKKKLILASEAEKDDPFFQLNFRKRSVKSALSDVLQLHFS